MSFEIGDKVRVIEKGQLVQEKDGGKGMIGVIKFIAGSIGVTSDEFKFDFHGNERVWWFQEYMLELVDGEPLAQASQIQFQSQSQYNTVCVRCGAPAYFGLNNTECSMECNKE